MCNTPYCFGDCKECELDAKQEEELNKVCPNREECNWISTDIKTDKCLTCGDTYYYS